jgi:5-methylcytosine-specific restriction endonuclease McrA
MSNLAAICEPCHLRKTAMEANAAKPKRRREPEAHPGVVCLLWQ